MDFVRLSDWDEAPWKYDFSEGFVDLEPENGWWGNFPFTKTIHTDRGPVVVTMVYEWTETPHGFRDTFTFKGPFNRLVVLDDDEFNELVRAPLSEPIDHPSFSTVEEYLEHHLIDFDTLLMEEDIEVSFDLEDLVQEQIVGAGVQNRKGLYKKALTKEEALPKIIQYLKDIDFGHGSEDELKKLENVSTMLAALGIEPTDVDLAISAAGKDDWEKARNYVYGPSGRGSNLGALEDLQNMISNKKEAVRVSSFLRRMKVATTPLAEELYLLLDSIVDWTVYEPNYSTTFLSTTKDKFTASLIFDSVSALINKTRKSFGLKPPNSLQNGFLWEGVRGETVLLTSVPDRNSVRINVEIRGNIN